LNRLRQPVRGYSKHEQRNPTEAVCGSAIRSDEPARGPPHCL